VDYLSECEFAVHRYNEAMKFGKAAAIELTAYELQRSEEEAWAMVVIGGVDKRVRDRIREVGWQNSRKRILDIFAGVLAKPDLVGSYLTRPWLMTRIKRILRSEGNFD
jgi:hypothetical protein